MKPVIDEVVRSLAGDWIPTIYSAKIRVQRTRSYEFDVPVRENRPEILFTLLGIDLKVGKRRFGLPDLATARYLSVFVRLGIRSVAIPYDITKISVVADELEVAWQKTLLIISEITKSDPRDRTSRVRSAVIKRIRQEVNEIGPGTKMPTFETSTRQRNS